MMKRILVGLALFSGLIGLYAQDREGNFDIRFEPTAKLQTGAPIPFQILVKNDLSNPVQHAQVKLQIINKDQTFVESYKAPEVAPGTYIAKPVFPSAGDWNVYVQVRREGAASSRSLQFAVPE